MLRELSLFSGAGGGLLGTKLLGWRAVGYVERDAYCQAVLEARIADGLLDPAPIFGDIRAFLRDGWGERYRGVADVVTAGVPCQPHSVAARGRSRPDEMWEPTVRVIEAVQPRFVLLENVLGVRRSLPLWISDLRGLGFHVEPPLQASAAAVGAGHIRERIWVLAHADREQLWVEPGGCGGEGGEEAKESRGHAWWSREPGVPGVADGVANRVDRLRALGNGQVPAVVVRAWRELYERMERRG